MRRRALIGSIAATTATGGCLRTELGGGSAEATDTNGPQSDTKQLTLSGQSIDWTQYRHNAANTASVDATVGPTAISETKDGTVDVDESFAISGSYLIGGGERFDIPVALEDSLEIVQSAQYSAVIEDTIVLSGTGDDGLTGWVGAFDFDGSNRWRTDYEPIDDDRTFPMGPPGIAGTTLFQATGDGILRAVDIESGVIKYQYDLGGQKRVTPAQANGLTFVTGRDTVALTDSGDEAWKRSFAFTSSPVVEGDTLYAVGQVDSYSTEDSEPSEIKGLYGLDAGTGEIKWATKLGDLNYPGVGNIAVDDSAIYVNTKTSLAAVEKSTRELRFNKNSDNSGEVIATDQRIYAVGKSPSAGSITARWKDSGEELWTEVIASPIMTEPVVSNNRLYVGAGNGLHVLIE